MHNKPVFHRCSVDEWDKLNHIERTSFMTFNGHTMR